MNFYEVIEKRTSIRKFKQTEIDYGKLSKMIDAAMRAPSWKNNTSFRIIVVQDENKKKQISDTIMNNTEEAAISIRQAPVTIIVAAEPNSSGSIANKEYYMVDSAIAMEHIILAATNEGYGTCWIGAFDEDKIRNILNIPHNFRIVAITPVGEIAEHKEHYPKKDINDYVFLDNWNEAYTEKQPMMVK